MANPAQNARDAMSTLVNDLDLLERIDRYSRGDHDDPYVPDNADAEYRLLTKRCKTNITEFAVGTVAQAMYVDGFRMSPAGSGDSLTDSISNEWKHWQRSRLDGRQGAIYRGALTFGHSFTVTERVPLIGVRTRGLSALKTVALFQDAANDEDPRVALTVTRWPKKDVPGEAIMWDAKYRYVVTFKSLLDKESMRVGKRTTHGLPVCPVTRFAATVDLEGRTTGIIEPLFPLQDRLNQAVFDMLMASTFASVKVRTASGMAVPMKMKPEYDTDGSIIGQVYDLDEQGNPQPEEIQISARRLLIAEDPDTKFGTLDETPLEGFIAAIEMSLRNIAALSQIPPHHLLGQIANLSAEALQAADTALSRKVSEFQAGFGESWERVFRLAAVLEGEAPDADDFTGEVIWRDMENRNMAQAGDSLGKLQQFLQIPARGLWSRVPGVTSQELDYWDELRENENTDLQIAQAMQRTGATNQSMVPTFREPPPPAQADGEVIG